MQNRQKLFVFALLCTQLGYAQSDTTAVVQQSDVESEATEAAFTFTEAQLGEDDDATRTTTVIGSNNNVYASEAGYRFSPMRFKYRAYNSKYNEVYINGNPANDIERGDFNFSFVGGLNNQTRSVEMSLPYDYNNFTMSSIGGSNNYNFRPSSMPVGHRVSLAGANRSYTVRGMYTYNSGISEKGWAFSGALTYRWANRGYIEGTFYNSLSYFLGIEKLINDSHSLSLVTWGNPTERAAQAASTDEMYWIANSNFYNPNWGYQGGEKRNARVVKSFAPAALFTWDWKISDKTKLVTSVLGKYSMYSNSRLNYNGSTNPAPDYYSSMPSAFFDVWNPNNEMNTEYALSAWYNAYSYLASDKAHRQINWDQMYFANMQNAAAGKEAMYYLQRYHDDQLTINLSSTATMQLSDLHKINYGIVGSFNQGYHYQTMDDLLGASYMRNINTYVLNAYGEADDRSWYDIDNKGQYVMVGDRFGYDYNINVHKATAWAGYSGRLKDFTLSVAGRINGTMMWRYGKMRNGLAPLNSKGAGRKAYFLDGGGRATVTYTPANTPLSIYLSGTYELKAPTARTAFVAPQVNNDFANNLKLERVFGVDAGFSWESSFVNGNFSAYYTRMLDVAEYAMAYSDTENSFTYISMTGMNKTYMGMELGLSFKISPVLGLKAIGSIHDAKYTNDADVTYMRSKDGISKTTWCVNHDMREGGTPLTAVSLDLGFHKSGWFIDLIGSWYDRIYLYYSPTQRMYAWRQPVTDDSGSPIKDTEGNPLRDTSPIEQAKGRGGFMLDFNIGKSIYLKKGSLSLNLMLNNILNNTKICTGGMEQNRSDFDSETGESIRNYSFQKSPKKFYANGINGMFIVTYRF